MRDAALYRAIMEFPIDEEGVRLRFVDRLARENGWSAAFAERVVHEYRRFAYLATVGDHPMTPSDEVDQAWHLHMLYTESYFDRFCDGVLGRRLTHGPTKGGHAEGAKFEDWYAKTKATYRAEFGEDPPVDVWPPSDIRFGKAPNMVRVDRSQYILLDKRQLRRNLMIAALTTLAFVALGCVATASPRDNLALPIILGITCCAGLFAIVLVLVLRKVGKGSSSGHSGGDSGCGHSGGDSGGDSGCGSSGCSSGCGGGCGGGGD